MHQFVSMNDTTLDQFKLHSITDQTGIYIYKASKVLAKYLGPLAKNKYKMRDTLISQIYSKVPHLMIIMKMFCMTCKPDSQDSQVYPLTLSWLWGVILPPVDFPLITQKR